MKASFLRHMAVCDLFLIYVPISLKFGIHVQYNHVNPELQWSPGGRWVVARGAQFDNCR